MIDFKKNTDTIRELRRENEANVSEIDQLKMKLSDTEKAVNMYKEQATKLKNQYKDQERAINGLKRTNDEIVIDTYLNFNK